LQEEEESVRKTLEEEEEDLAPAPEDEEEGDEPAEPDTELAEPESGDASLEEILTKKPEERPATEEEEEEESILTLGREEPIETLSVKVVPQQPTEFTCRKCYLVKHRSQLADKKRMYCRDCA
jgi:Domain of unknown function (DUF4193)